VVGYLLYRSKKKKFYKYTSASLVMVQKQKRDNKSVNLNHSYMARGICYILTIHPPQKLE
jgi:hypothetical protein